MRTALQRRSSRSQTANRTPEKIDALAIRAKYRRFQTEAYFRREWDLVGWYAFHLDVPLDGNPFVGEPAGVDWTHGWQRANRENQ